MAHPRRSRGFTGLFRHDWTSIPPYGRSGMPPHHLVFYDSTCGFCHGSIRFLVFRDPKGLMAFAPLGGGLWRDRLPETATPQDTLVVLAPNGTVRVRWRAVRTLAGLLGGGWRWVAPLLWLVPPFLGDLLYRLVAHHRHRLVGRTTETCPMLPPDLRRRFDLTP